MKRLGLILLACLMLALQAVAQAPEKAAPDDLVVTAEIVGYSREPGSQDIYGKVLLPYICLHTRMTVRNMTHQTRAILMYNCDWPSSWIANGPHSLFIPTYQKSCDRNFVESVAIPAGEALIFDCPLFMVNRQLLTPDELNEAVCFRLGLIDFITEADLRKYNSINGDVNYMLQKSRTIYWSNTLTDNIDLKNIKLVTGHKYLTYHLTKEVNK